MWPEGGTNCYRNPSICYDYSFDAGQGRYVLLQDTAAFDKSGAIISIQVDDFAIGGNRTSCIRKFLIWQPIVTDLLFSWSAKNFRLPETSTCGSWCKNSIPNYCLPIPRQKVARSDTWIRIPFLMSWLPQLESSYQISCAINTVGDPRTPSKHRWREGGWMLCIWHPR